MENLCRGYPQRRRERVAAGLVRDCVPISANRRKSVFRDSDVFGVIKNRHSLPNLRVRTFQKHIYKSVMVKFRFPTCKTHEENSKTSLVISLRRCYAANGTIFAALRFGGRIDQNCSASAFIVPRW
jgi:hypothetical protein